ncbi:hypothetical protein C8Q73DRAFT_796344 [Cubamyces lactineus]|nr:hypothetical protein C8Q73DRAFT_796344 [Cubamyces lactineus]
MSSKASPRTNKSINRVNTAEQANKDFHLEHWRREVYEKVNVYSGTLDDFLDLFVPSETQCPLDPPSEQIAADFTPLQGREVEHYGPLISIFSQIVADFPEEKRVSFCNTFAQEFPFPFSAFAEHHHTSKPDISVSFPGDKLPVKLEYGDWNRVAMVMEAKSTAAEDAFDIKAGLDRTNAIVQLAVGARNLMLTHGFLAAYSIGIYGDMIRIVRFDHACAVASKTFSIKTQEGLRIVQRFFWRFVHPLRPSKGAVVGQDETVSKMTREHRNWLREVFGGDANELLAGVDLREGRVVEVWSNDLTQTEPSGRYILFKLLDYELRIVKESWRQVIRIPEHTFYDRLHMAIPMDEWTGLPGFVGGGDLGAREAAIWDHACSDLEGKRKLRSHTVKPSPLPARPMHQTFTWRLVLGQDTNVNERSHMRIVVDTVGRPLSCFKSTRELVAAIRDAIKGHRLAMERAGLLHRDVSSGNILIVDRAPPGRDVAGILHDFDYSSMTNTPPSKDNAGGTWDASDPPKLHPLELWNKVPNIDEYKERTGTYYFMAIEILDPKIKVVIHHAGHDLESFYWKRGTLQGHRLEIIDNEPLSELLERFKELVDDATTLKMHRRKPLTYDAVLSIFDEALMREDWPEGDAALPFVLESTRTASVYGPKHPKIRSRAPNHPKRSRIEDVLEAEHTDLDSETSRPNPRTHRQSEGDTREWLLAHQKPSEPLGPHRLPWWLAAQLGINQTQACE